MDAADVLAMSAICLILFLLMYMTAIVVGLCIVYVIDWVWPDIKRVINGRR